MSHDPYTFDDAGGSLVVFDHVPSLEELRPAGGVPGLWYALVPAELIGQFEKRGYRMPRRPTSVTLEGPKGSVASLLLEWGTPIGGASQASSTAPYDVHPTLLERTGLAMGDAAAPDRGEPKTAAPPETPAKLPKAPRPPPERAV